MAKGTGKERKPGKPFDSLEAEAFLVLLQTAERLQERAAEIMKPHGLSPTQYNALRILRGAGALGLACREIGERMIHHDPDITRLLDRLEGRGLVARSRGREDRRVMKTRITEAGLARLQALDRPVERFERRLLGRLPKHRLRTLIRLLEAVQGAPGSRIAADDPGAAGLADLSRRGGAPPPAWAAELRGRRRLPG